MITFLHFSTMVVFLGAIKEVCGFSLFDQSSKYFGEKMLHEFSPKGERQYLKDENEVFWR